MLSLGQHLQGRKGKRIFLNRCRSSSSIYCVVDKKLNLDKENIVSFFNYFIKGMAEQEEAQQGVGGGQLGDDLQVGDICKLES